MYHGTASASSVASKLALRSPPSGWLQGRSQSTSFFARVSTLNPSFSLISNRMASSGLLQPAAAAAAATAAHAAAAVASSADGSSSGSSSATLAPVSPKWKAMLQASLKSSRQRDSSYIQLATVRPDGRPANRTVVFRGFVQNSCRILIFTDTRSGKIEELAQNPWAEICWYFSESREQYRIQGIMTAVGPSHSDGDLMSLREKTWKGMSLRQRIQFGCPPPGSPFLSPPPPDSELEEMVKGPTPVDTFAIVVMDPSLVDYLILRGNKRSMHRLQKDGSWVDEKVHA